MLALTKIAKAVHRSKIMINLNFARGQPKISPSDGKKLAQACWPRWPLFASLSSPLLANTISNLIPPYLLLSGKLCELFCGCDSNAEQGKPTQAGIVCRQQSQLATCRIWTPPRFLKCFTKKLKNITHKSKRFLQNKKNTQNPPDCVYWIFWNGRG